MLYVFFLGLYNNKISDFECKCAKYVLIIVKDIDGEIILFHDSFIHNLILIIPMFKPDLPNYHFHCTNPLITGSLQCDMPYNIVLE